MVLNMDTHCVALLTDFGNGEHVGIMKGVITSISPTARIIDLYHHVRPQNVLQGAWVLRAAYKYFPRGCIFTCVVDPTVGTRRKAVIVQSKNYFFIAPDNGLIYPTATRDGIVATWEIPVKSINVSRTFHGRDVFARAAGLLHLNKEKYLDELQDLSSIEKLEFVESETKGQIVHVDHFGNITTSLIPPKKLPSTIEIVFRNNDGNTLEVKFEIFRTYAKGTSNKPFLIVGSANTFEISLKNGSAWNWFTESFPLEIGTILEVK